MIFPEAYDPYGSLISEEINDDFSKDVEGIDIVLPVANAETPELNKREHGSFLQENYSKFWIDTENNKKITTLISFGIVAGIGVLLLKRYWK